MTFRTRMPTLTKEDCTSSGSAGDMGDRACVLLEVAWRPK